MKLASTLVDRNNHMAPDNIVQNNQHAMNSIGSLHSLAPDGRVRFDAEYNKLHQSIEDRHGDGFGLHHPWRILLAEDDASFRTVFKNIIELLGFSVCVVENGRDALAALSNGAFDMALLDINMPEVDGLTVTREIRARADQVADLPIIALTSDVTDTKVRDMMDVGFDGVMSKPTRRNDLFHVILAAMSNRTRAEQESDHERRASD